MRNRVGLLFQKIKLTVRWRCVPVTAPPDSGLTKMAAALATAVIIVTSRVPVEGKSSVWVICMKDRIIIFNYYHYQPGSNNIIVYGKHITHARMHAHTLTHTPTHRRCRCSMGRCAPNHDEVNAPFSPVPLAMNGRSVLHSNKQSRMRRGYATWYSRQFWVFFVYTKF